MRVCAARVCVEYSYHTRLRELGLHCHRRRTRIDERALVLGPLATLGIVCGARVFRIANHSVERRLQPRALQHPLVQALARIRSHVSTRR